MIEPLRKPQGSEELLGPLARSLRVGAVDELRQDDVLDSVEFRQEVMELVDEAQEIAANPGSAIVVEVRSFLAVQPDRTFKPALE
jgi:hypothetical protein